jgi:hypothetical protein
MNEISINNSLLAAIILAAILEIALKGFAPLAGSKK